MFEITVASFDTELDVIADTVAMSKPHEIEYTLLLIFYNQDGRVMRRESLLVGCALIRYVNVTFHGCRTARKKYEKQILNKK